MITSCYYSTYNRTVVVLQLLSQLLGYSGTLFNRPPTGTLLLRRLHYFAENNQ